ncbi:MAG: DNA repair protein RecO [Candidatus Doudnabacteria bacterium]
MAEAKEIRGFVIKQQQLGEADILLTFFSQEQGKTRMVIKAAKRVTSKLQSALQPYYLSQVSLVGKGELQNVISSQVLESYAGVLQTEIGMRLVSVVQEFLYRALPDEQVNTQLFNLVLEFYKLLNNHQDLDFSQGQALVVQFYSLALLAIGLNPESNLVILEEPKEVFLSNQEGGFAIQRRSVSDIALPTEAYKEYLKLSKQPMVINVLDNQELLTAILGFVNYQLERKFIAGEYFLT